MYRRAYPQISLLSFLSIHLYRAQAALVNRTIDDEYGDSVTGQKLTYYPPDASRWKQGKNCPDCIISLNSSLVQRGTWHDCTQHQDDPEMCSITAHFNGTAVFVYNALSSYKYSHRDGQRTVTYLTFELDGHAVDEFLDNRDGGVRYDVPVYANHSLADGPHTLVIRVPPGPTGKDWSVALFDYIMYTTSTDQPTTPPDLITTSSSTTSSLLLPPAPIPSHISPPSSPYTAGAPAVSSMSPGAIAGATLGSVGIAVVVVLAFLLARRRASSSCSRGYPNELSRSSFESTERLPVAQNGGMQGRLFSLPRPVRSRAESDARPPSSSDDHSHGFSETMELRQQMARIQELVEGQSVSEGEVGTGRGWI